MQVSLACSFNDPREALLTPSETGNKLRSHLMSKTRRTRMEKNCDLYSKEAKAAVRLRALISELAELLPEFKSDRRDAAEAVMDNIDGLCDFATDQLFYQKQCPFVNSCINQMKGVVAMSCEQHGRLTQKQCLAVFDACINSKTIEC
eukprot:TRINITY_DN15338_c0_g2_i1.p2 TRINITY_DN15338_c0_g2~~TRINITY_DN15338_c0_g2_i1.p2  ORF type:complete len:147 (+),score=28.74 TRINITY_DN15338_c0_g2_i1:102-542(+)